MKARRLLLTAFEPFAGRSENVSALVASQLAEASFAPHILNTAVLPVSYKRAPLRLCECLDQLKPDIVFATGESAASSAISLERIAVNLCDSDRADNDGLCLTDQPVRTTGTPAACFSSLPVKLLVETGLRSGVRTELSNSAGTYICNALMYELLLQAEQRKIMAGFMHLPAGPNSPPISELTNAVFAMIQVAFDWNTNVK